MATMDADAHVVESDHTGDYLDRADRQYRPGIVHPEGGTAADFQRLIATEIRNWTETARAANIKAE